MEDRKKEIKEKLPRMYAGMGEQMIRGIRWADNNPSEEIINQVVRLYKEWLTKEPNQPMVTYIKENWKRQIDPEELARIAAHECGVPTRLLYEPYRRREVADCRDIIYYILYNEYIMSTTQIARMFNRSGSSVVTGVENMRGWLATPKANRKVIDAYNRIKEVIKQKEDE